MYADYFALSSCAFLVLHVPFLIVAQLRFSHVLQREGYDNRRYFGWIKEHFLLAYLFPICVFVVNIVSESILSAYLDNTYLYMLQDTAAYIVMFGYAIIALVIALVITLILWRYLKAIKIECETVPLVCSDSLVKVFVLSCVLICALVTAESMFIEIRRMVYFVPLLAPLFVPLSNALWRGKREEGRDDHKTNILESE